MVPTPPPLISTSPPPSHSPHHPRGARGLARGSMHIRVAAASTTAPAVAQWQQQQEQAAAGAGVAAGTVAAGAGCYGPLPCLFFILKVIFNVHTIF